MKAIMRGPYNGWHYQRETCEWVLYVRGRITAKVAGEDWENYKRWRNRGY